MNMEKLVNELNAELDATRVQIIGEYVARRIKASEVAERAADKNGDVVSVMNLRSRLDALRDVSLYIERETTN